MELERKREALLQMWQIREFENTVHQLFLQGELHGTTHLYNGQEAVAVGVCAALNQQDLITSTHRGHGHTIAKGAQLKPMMAEILGKETGYCKGKGGSMHASDFSSGSLGATGVVGGGHSVAVGGALAKKMKGENAVTVCFMGDGSTNEGSFHESLNLAAFWQLPVIFVCEDNLYGISMGRAKATNNIKLEDRAISYNIKGLTVDGNNLLEVYAAAVKAKDHALKSGPVFMVAETYRYMGHSKSDENLYRSTEEIESWQKKDPIIAFEKHLAGEGLSEKELEEIHATAVKQVADALEFARESKLPSLSTLTKGVYAKEAVK